MAHCLCLRETQHYRVVMERLHRERGGAKANSDDDDDGGGDDDA